MTSDAQARTALASVEALVVVVVAAHGASVLAMVSLWSSEGLVRRDAVEALVVVAAAYGASALAMVSLWSS